DACRFQRGPFDYQTGRHLMLYMLLLYGSESGDEPPPTDAERRRLFEAYREFTDWLKARGSHRDGAPLAPASPATAVRVSEGKTRTPDGPFAETSEQLGGYYLVDAANLDEAIEIAARVPRARSGTVEIRPVA